MPARAYRSISIRKDFEQMTQNVGRAARQAAVSLAALFLTATGSLADEPVNFGARNYSCSKYLTDARENHGKGEYAQWIASYLTAVNRLRDVNILVGENFEDAVRWVALYCGHIRPRIIWTRPCIWWSHSCIGSEAEFGSEGPINRPQKRLGASYSQANSPTSYSPLGRFWCRVARSCAA